MHLMLYVLGSTTKLSEPSGESSLLGMVREGFRNVSAGSTYAYVEKTPATRMCSDELRSLGEMRCGFVSAAVCHSAHGPATVMTLASSSKKVLGDQQNECDLRCL
jgi:hypothetical protein